MVMDLHSRGLHSLKEKRHIVSSIKEKMRQKFNISIIESAYQDTWQEIQLAVTMVSNSKVIIEKVFQQMEDFICLNYPVRIVSVNKDYT